MSDPWKKYWRKSVAELRPFIPGELLGPYVLGGGSPKEGDMIARNPENHADQWLVSKAYFEANFEEIPKESTEPYRRIHVDQGRRATNRVKEADYDIIRVDNARGDPLLWGGTVLLLDGPSGRLIAKFVQPMPDRAYVVVEPDALVLATAGKREE